MAGTTYNEEQLRKGFEREAIQVEDSVVRIEDEIYHKELYRKLPFKVIFGGLNEDEKKLVQLVYVDEMSISEIAEAMGKDKKRVAWDVNRLRNKIRNRVKSALQKDDAANKLMLAWEKISSKRNRISSKRNRIAS